MNKQAESFSFSILPLVIRLECQETGELPLFLGSTIRGVLGWTLLKAKSDIYSYLFEAETEKETKTHLVKPYLIEPPKPKAIYHKGEKLQFILSLLGNANVYASELVRALLEQKEFKLGSRRMSFKLLSITHAITFKQIWDEAVDNMKVTNLSSIAIPPEKQVAEWLSIQLQTPLRIRRKGKLVTDLDFSSIIRNITMRMKELTMRYGGFVNNEEIEKICELAKEIHLTSSEIRYYEMKRYSNKINAKMDFTGVLGSLTFEGELTNFTPWIMAAHFLHIGRNTTFGCGKIEVVMM